MNGPIINGEEYTLIVLKVVERDERGRPSKVQVGYDDTTFNVADGDEFLTAFVKTQTVTPKVRTQ